MKTQKELSDHAKVGVVCLYKIEQGVVEEGALVPTT